MRSLLPFLKLFRHSPFSITLGMILSIVTLIASIALLTLSGWFLAASALAGLAALTTFNYMLPAAGVRGCAIFRTAARYFERLVNHNITLKILSKLRVYTFSKLLPLTPARIGQFNRAELLNRLVADVDTLDHLYLRLIVPFITAIVVIITVSVTLAFIDLHLAITLGAILLALLFLMPTLFYHQGKKSGIAITCSRSQYRQKIIAWLQSYAELAVYLALPRFRRSMDEIENEWLNNQQQQAHLTALSQALIMLLSGLTFIFILWLAADNPELGALIALFVFATLASFETLAPIPTAFLHVSQVIASAQRLEQLLEQQPEVNFSQNKSQIVKQAELLLSDVCFSYPNQPQAVLKYINLVIKPGQHVALLGKTGCGKSTLLQLLTRAWDPQRGEIRLNNQPLTDFDEATLRQAMAVVPQRTHLFSATLRQNLLVANPDATDQQLSTVLLQVGLANLLEDNGLNSWLGDGGRLLSGGELRRFALARALLHQAPLIILDEPTEGLDSETESQILSLIQQYCQHKTLIMITHRLNSLESFDSICIMDNGAIVEQGTHQELMTRQQHYWQLRQHL